MIYIHWLIFVIYAVVVVLTMITILMDNRQPAKTMAWILVLWFIPLLGIILYFFFGQNIRREHIVSKKSLDQLTKRSMFEFVEQRNLTLPDEHQEAYRPLYKPADGTSFQGKHGGDIQGRL